jgi:hypothetical protein
MDESKIDAVAMGRLAKALAFICGPENPATQALKKASETGEAKDIKAARTLFLKLRTTERQAALSMIDDD